MMMVVRAALALSLAACVALPAAEVPPPQPLAQPPALGKPFLGIQLEDQVKPGAFDAGVPVKVVVPESTAAKMGLQAGDLIQGINGQPVASIEDLKARLEPLKIGDQVSIDLERKGQKMTLVGMMLAHPPPPLPLPLQIVNLQKEIEELKKRSAHPPDLAETLETLVKELDALRRDLPAASEAFHKLYPDGDFSVKIEITITSDKNAKNPVVIGNGASTDATAPTTGAAVAPLTPVPPAHAP